MQVQLFSARDNVPGYHIQEIRCNPVSYAVWARRSGEVPKTRPLTKLNCDF